MKKRILSLVLCVCLIASLSALFSSCAKKTVELGAGYQVVYAGDVSDSISAQITEFTDTLKKKADKNIKKSKVKADEALENVQDLEILIGNTNRPESQKALKEIKGHGYIIALYGKKIVIVGTTNLLTALALDHFTETYLAGKESVSSLTVTKTEAENVPMLEFTNKWTFVHASYLESDRDYVGVKIYELKAMIPTFSDVRATAMPLILDTDAANQEILAGVVNRAEAKAVLSGMDVTDYGIGAKNGKLLISAHNDGMMEKAFTLFADALRDSVCVVEDEKQILLPADFLFIYTDRESSVITDFPRPEGLALSGSIDVHEGMEYYYEGDGVTAQAYDKYCKSLVAAGYTLYTDNTVENSIFRIYTNKEKNVTLYVAYNDFKHAAKQKTDHKKAIRIVASRLSGVNLLDRDMLSQDLSYTKLQNSSITAVKMDYSNDGGGNLYVVTLEDGSFILLDGGAQTTADTNRIYQVLLALYKKGHGNNMPTTNDPIRIAAWYLSHGHHDHYGSMVAFIQKYCANYKQYSITIDRVIANFASDEQLYNSEFDRDPGSFSTVVRNNLAKYSSYISDVSEEEAGFTYYKVHTGDTFWLANIEFEVMYTHEDQYPRRLHWYNDSSVVIRMNIHHTENRKISQDSETSVLWLGDAMDISSKWLRATWGEYLQSDMVQIAHHGSKGCELALYQLIAPTCALWPNSVKNFNDRYHNPKSTDWRRVGYGICYEIPTLKYIIMCDVYNYTVTITKTGADYSIGGNTGICTVGEDVSSPIRYDRVSSTTTSGIMKTKYCTD